MALAMLTSPVMWMNLLMKGVWEAVVIDGTLKVMAAAQISLLLHRQDQKPSISIQLEHLGKNA